MWEHRAVGIGGLNRRDESTIGGQQVGIWTDVEKVLAVLGDEGWELVAVVHELLFFKRLQHDRS